MPKNTNIRYLFQNIFFRNMIDDIMTVASESDLRSLYHEFNTSDHPLLSSLIPPDTTISAGGMNTTPLTWRDASLYRVIPLSLILALVGIFTVLGNIFVIGAVYYERSLRSITNMFVVSKHFDNSWFFSNQSN